MIQLTQSDLIEAHKEGKVERFCFVDFEGNQVWSKVLHSKFEADINGETYRIIK